MAIPNTIPSESTEVIQSYDFVDIITGTAYQRFYLSQTRYVDTKVYALTTLDFYSDVIELTIGSGTSLPSYTLKQTDTYDISIGIGRRVSGTAIFNFNGKGVRAAGAGNFGFYLDVDVIHYDGSTETVIGTNKSKAIGTTAVSAAVPFTLTETLFKRGDILRLKVEIWGRNADASNNGTFTYGIDPKNRQGTILGSGEFTQSALLMPFKVFF